ncbi:MAG: VWA domain-containing protein, partial [Anaerolineae bacterium]
LWSANPRAGLYYAMAVYDGDTSDPENETYPVVVQFLDEGFDVVTRYWQGRWLDRRTAAADGAIQAPVRLSTAPDGTLMLTDDYGLRQRGHDGQLIAELPVAAYPSRRNRMQIDPELTVGEGRDGRVMGVAQQYVGRRWLWQVFYGETEVRRYCVAGRCEINPYIKVIWDSVVPQMTVPRDGLAAVAHEPTLNQFVVLSRYNTAPSSRGVEAIEYRVLIYPLNGWGLKTMVPLEGDDREVIYADIDAGPTGRIYVLDTLNDKVVVLAPDGTKLMDVPTPKDAWRVAGGPNDEMYFLTVYGHVVRTSADGTELSRFVARPHEGVPPTSLVDIAVDAYGWVYAVDELANQVTVFAPEGTEDDVLIGDKCSVAGDKWADPRDLLLGDNTTLYLALFGTCGFVEQPADIVIAVNTKGHTLADDPGRELANRLRSARQIAALTDLDRHRLGVVAYAVDSNREAPLSHDSYQIMLGLRDARADRGDLSRTYAGLKEASDLFDAESASRQRVIILMEASDDETDEASIAFAEALKADGVLIMNINDTAAVASGDLFDDIEVDPRAMGAGKPAHRRMVVRQRPDSIITSGTLTDKLPTNMRFVTGSASPPAAWDAATRTLTWTLSDLALHATHAFQLEVEPLDEGEWPTNVEAVATVLDGWGNPHTVTLPVPKVRVYGELPPTATPTPTATHTPEPTPTPGPTAVPKPLYLPLLLRDRCTPKDRNADVALVLDASGSMSDTTSANGPSKLEAAKDAARTFLEQLVDGRDQSALVQFNNEATVLAPLSATSADTAAALDSITQATGTRIDLALDAGRQVLTGEGHRPDNNPVLILLTDGEPTGTTEEDVLAAAQRAADADLLVFTIGLGSEVDHELLRLIASEPDWYFHAPDTSDLEAIYDQIVEQIPCVPRWP